MFGYVRTDLPNLYVKDTILYKACYCGLCKSIGRSCGQRGRLLLNYDLSFLSAFAHNVTGKDIDIKRQRCVIHPITKRPVAVPDELSERIARLTIILAYYKLTDDIIDTGKGRARRAFFKKAYARAKKVEPVLDGIVRRSYDELLQAEKTCETSTDKIADPFGKMMREAVAEILGEYYSESIGEFSYNLGKWIYLIDAADDFDKDKKRKNFNVFANMFADIENKDRLLKEKGEELREIFGIVLSGVYNGAKGIKYKFNHDLTDNIIYKGLFEQTKSILEGKRCKNTIKY